MLCKRESGPQPAMPARSLSPDEARTTRKLAGEFNGDALQGYGVGDIQPDGPESDEYEKRNHGISER